MSTMSRHKPHPQGIHPKKRIGSCALSLALLCCIAIGMLIRGMIPSGSSGHDCLSNLDFIRPNLDCSVSDEKMQRMSALQDKLEAIVPTYAKSGKADKIGVFVRDMNTTRYAGVNDGDTFIMASLLKVPLLIAGFKLAEVEPKILDQEIAYAGSPDRYAEQNFPIEDRLIPNRKYTVKELMRRSVVFSDNTASELLANAYPAGFFDRILRALGLQIRLDDGNEENFTTPRSYANIFRNLYNSSYLTREYSNAALEMLTHTNYVNGAIAGLPQNTVVAHKFAERTVFDSRTKEMAFRQLHECGLVYAENGKSPYTFCIMTEGKDFSDLEQIQRELSHAIFETISD